MYIRARTTFVAVTVLVAIGVAATVAIASASPEPKRVYLTNSAAVCESHLVEVSDLVSQRGQSRDALHSKFSLVDTLTVDLPRSGTSTVTFDLFSPDATIGRCLAQLNVMPGSVWIAGADPETGLAIDASADRHRLSESSDGSKLIVGPFVPDDGSERDQIKHVMVLMAQTRDRDSVRIVLVLVTNVPSEVAR